MSFSKSVFIVFFILLIDQASKIYVKTNFLLGESINVFGKEDNAWFKIYFIENEGMAWGAEIPGNYGKLILTLFRIVAVFAIGWWLKNAIQEKKSNYLITAIALILAGALGNIIDSVFYGVVFNESTSQLATFGAEQPYGTWFHGKVVDMFYFPIYKFENMPSWFPFADSDGSFTFFNAIFNIADVAISTGVGILLVFNKKAFGEN